MFYIMIKGLITGTPRKLAMVSLILFLLGTCSSVALLGDYALLNPGSILFFSLALLLFVPVLGKYLIWRRMGLTQPLIGHAVLFQMDHITSVATRSRPVLGVRETTRSGYTQPVVLTPPPADSQNVTVACVVCQQEAVFLVDSLQVRQARRVRTALIWGGVLLLSLGLAVLSSDAVQPAPQAGWVGTARVLFFIMFLSGVIGFGTLLSYIGARYRKLPAGHRVRFPEKSELIDFRSKYSVRA